AVIGFIAGAFASHLSPINNFMIYNEQNAQFGRLDLSVAFSDSRPSFIFEITVNETAEKALSSSINKGLFAKWKSLANQNIVFGVNYESINTKCSFETETIHVERPKGLFIVILDWIKSILNPSDSVNDVNHFKELIRNELHSEYYSFGDQYNSNNLVKFITGQFIAFEFDGIKFYGIDNLGNCSYFILTLNEKLIVLKVGDVFVPIEYFVNNLNSGTNLNTSDIILDINLRLLKAEKFDSNVLNEVEVKFFSSSEVSARNVTSDLKLLTINTTIDVNNIWATGDRKRILFVEDLNNAISILSESDKQFLQTSMDLKSFIHGMILGKRRNSDERVIVNIDVMKSGFTTTDLEARRVILRNDSLLTELYSQMEIKVANNGDELFSLFQNAKLQMEKHKINHESYSFAAQVTQQMFVLDTVSNTVHNSFLEFREVKTQSDRLRIHFDDDCVDDEQLFYLPCYFDEDKKEKAVLKGVKVLEKFSKLAKEERTEYLDWVEDQRVVGPKSEKVEKMANLRKAEKLLKKANQIPVLPKKKDSGLKFGKNGFKYFKKSTQNLKIFRKVEQGATKVMKPLKGVGKAISKYSGPGLSAVSVVFSGTRLVNDIIELKDVKDETERNEKIASIVVDGVTIVVDIALIVLKIVNAALASSVGGPVTLAIGALSIIGTGIYKGVKRVNEIENQIGQLSVVYKIGEGLRGFFGFDASGYVQHLIRERKLLNQIDAERKQLQAMNFELAFNHSSLLVKDVVNFLIENNEFDAKVVPFQQLRKLPIMDTGECKTYKYHETGCCKTVWKVFSFGVCFAYCEKYKECTERKRDRPAANWENATIPDVVTKRISFTRFAETAKNRGGYNNEGKVINHGDDFFKIMHNSIVLIDEIMNYIRVSKTFKRELNEDSSARKMCYPFNTMSKYSNESGYYCKNAFGISYSLNRSELTSTLIDLEEGNDFAVGRT
ncbi:hypothetical protein, partial [Wolbachia endosymbiont of Pentidionis agamae]|uniref:hypothetical protein n=1 Tax=Wolbachia endosymbiont of Pentidionis agamae TaxID=3110435 RepID=UPI002FD4E912